MATVIVKSQGIGKDLTRGPPSRQV